MGMYTEIIFGATLKKDTPEEIIRTIEKLISDDKYSSNMPDHPFFSSDRVWLLRSGGSYYFPGTVEPKFRYDGIGKQWSLHFRTNIKNYDHEIEKFLDWIEPYLDDGSGTGDFYAIVTYEEAREPKIYYMKD